MKRLRILIGMVTAFCVVWVAGCSRHSVEGYLDIVKEQGGVSKEYLVTLNKWSRDKIVYSEFETKVRIATTYKSREFMDAYAKEYSRIYLLTKPEERKSMEVLAEQPCDATEFFFYAYIPDKESNDFAKKNSVWTIFLLDEKGNRFYPVEVRQVEKVTAVLEGFYPYGNQYYGSYYILKFPTLAPECKPPAYMKLVFTSVLGRIEQEWKSE